jgi:hypothetical protein
MYPWDDTFFAVSRMHETVGTPLAQRLAVAGCATVLAETDIREKWRLVRPREAGFYAPRESNARRACTVCARGLNRLAPPDTIELDPTSNTYRYLSMHIHAASPAASPRQIRGHDRVYRARRRDGCAVISRLL